MSQAHQDTVIDRAVTMLLGGLCGLFWGFLIAVLVGLVTNQINSSIVAWSVGIFALIGLVHGNVIMEVILASLHFIVGLANGIAENEQFEPEREAESHLRAFALVGFFTGLIILLAIWF